MDDKAKMKFKICDYFIWTTIEVICVMLLSSTEVDGICSSFGQVHAQCIPLEIPVFGIGLSAILLVSLLCWLPMLSLTPRCG